MASRGQSITITYTAIDSATGRPKTGDVTNHTLRWIKDGTAAAPTNSPTEVDATNAPGIYKLVLTATEAACDLGVLGGKSSTAGVDVIPVSISFENLPTAAPAASGGLPTVDATNRVAGVSGSIAGSVASVVGSVGSVTGAVGSVGSPVTVGTNNDKTGYGLSQAFPSNFSALAISGGGAVTAGTVSDKTGYTATVSDKTGFSLAPSEHTAIATDTQAGLTAQGYTTARSGYLDTLNGLIQAFWDKATSTLTTAGSVGKLLTDNINAAISSRMATFTYTAPDNASLATILSRTDVATSTRASATDYTSVRAAKLDNLDAAISTRSTYAGADTAGTATLLSRLPSTLTITSGKVDVNDKTGFSLLQAFPYNFSALAIEAGTGKVTTANPSLEAGGSGLTITDVQQALTNQGYTTLRAPKLDNLDATVGSRSTFAGGAVTSVTGAVGSVTAPVTVGVNNDKTGYGLTLVERTAIANEVESQIIDDTDAEKVLKAITDKIAAVNSDLSGLTLSAIAASVRTEIERAGGMLTGVRTKTDLLPGVAAGASGGLPLGDASGRVLLQPVQPGVTIPAVTTVTTVANLTGYVAPPTPPTTSQIAAAILVTPAQKIVTNAQGEVTTSNPATGGGGVDYSSQLDTIQAKTDRIPDSPAAVGSAMTLGSGERNSIADALLDRANGIETGMTLRQALRGISAMMFGRATGLSGAVAVFRAAVSNLKARVTITKNATTGDRSSVNLDLD